MLVRLANWPEPPRRRIQFWRLDRVARRDALRTIFDELAAYNLNERRAVIRRLEQIAYAHKHRLKPARYKLSPEKRRAMRRCWTALAALAALEKNPAHKNDYERQARWFKAMSRPPGRIPGRRKDGLDVLVKQLADFYTERTDRPAGRSRSKNGGAPGGPFVRLVKAVCDLLKLDEVTAEAIATLIGDMGNPQARRN